MHTSDKNIAVNRASESGSKPGSKVEAERDAAGTAAYQVGDTVVHWTHGSGKVTAIEDKGSLGSPCFYYIIDGRDQILWVPVDEGEKSSLHRPTSRTDFGEYISILRSPRKRLPDNPHHRRKELEPHIQQRSVAGACHLIRDLSFHSSWRKMNNTDTRILRTAISHLLDEWELSFGTPRAKAKRELEWILKEKPTSQGKSSSPGSYERGGD
jgi:RNA polymerase-interacting CarD/CdnL/TRCF family regulator